MLSSKFKKHFTIAIAFRIIFILVICGVIVYLFPKAGTFQYAYQKGSLWRYETLNAPFDFPIYKTDAELSAEREKITREQTPIFDLNTEIKKKQTAKFTEATEKYRNVMTASAIDHIRNKLAEIYTAGVLQIPEELNSTNIKTVKIVHNNIGKDIDFKKVYTLKKAYSVLNQTIDGTNLPASVKEHILSLNINHFIQPNLEFDASKTNLQLTNQLKNISLTQGLVRNGETIISKRELVTPEKIKLLNSLETEYRHNAGSYTTRFRIIGGQIILTLTSLIIFSLYFYYSKKRVFYDNKEFIFLYGAFLATVALGSAGYYQNINMHALPVLFFVLIVNILVGSRSALYLLLGTSLLISYFAPNSFRYLFMQITAGIVAIFSLAQLQRRGQLFLSIFLIFITYVAVYFSFILIQEGDISLSHIFGLLWLFVNCLLLSLAYPVIYIFERIFGFTSEITLMELSNPNHPALRALTKKAPGTFQHSLMVANLAEEAIYRIGGNPLLTRTGALYHDIGKSNEPIFFIENLSGGINPHDDCEFDESARHIINHVSQGVELAKKYNLPETIINFIRTHHGKSKVKYFYNSFRNKYPDRAIDEAAFTYDGPDPVSKECAVVMMADSVEAASRTLKEKTEENITQLVNNIIDGQVQDGRFLNAEITFRDIAYVKQVFIDMLTNIYHSRIAYPKLKKTEQTEEASPDSTTHEPNK
ncbi:HD family phosphohydrolase [Odoribacter lunatus]|uniref:HD family phosphohydrolase n=1 Tax=Odoribacter lunatus TaxID=2941335 RepID=UPI00203B1635|nr:HDIG domain-containing metalloprotein [Odoribacter lunatus]